MAARPVWKGYLKLSLVTCGVELSNATTYAEKVSFKVINKSTGNTVKRQYLDSTTGKAVDEKNQVKGYKTSDGEYLLIEEEDMDKVQIESSHTMSLDGFVDKSTIEQVYLDTPYYVAPSDKVSEEAFAVIRKALEDQKMAALARIVLYRRERPVVLEPMGNGMLLTTLRYDRTVRKADDIFDEIRDIKTDKDMVELATGIIDKKKAKFNPAKFVDAYENALIKMIEAKKSGRKVPAAKQAKEPTNVVNLFDALKKSLAEGGKGERKTTAKSAPAKKKRAAAAATPTHHTRQRKSA